MTRTERIASSNRTFLSGYKPKFAEPFSSKRHRDNEDALPSSASIYGAVSPPYRQKMSSQVNNIHPRHPIPMIIDRHHLLYFHYLLASLSNMPTQVSCLLSLSHSTKCFFSFRDQTFTHSPVSSSYHLLDINNERRLIVRCGMTITNYHISKLFDLVPNMEECSPLTLNTFNERK